MRNIIIILLFMFLYSSCIEGKKEGQKTDNDKELAGEVIVKNDIDIYELTDSLLSKQFGVIIKYINFHNNSGRRPENLDFIDTIGLVNVRGYIIPNFDKTYVSKNKENYLLFIYEYRTENLSKKSLINFQNDNILIQNKYKIGDFHKHGDRKLKRLNGISVCSKYGGMIFSKNRFIISVVETCRKPLTLERLKWDDYEKIFLETYLKVRVEKTLILKANCGDMYFVKELYNDD